MGARILDRPVYTLATGEVITVRDLVRGAFGTGATGSGKSANLIKQLACGFLRYPDSGALFLVPKAEDIDTYLEWMQALGRIKDVILFTEQSGHRIDPVFLAHHASGRGSHSTETVIDFLATLTDCLKPGQQRGGGDSQFFLDAVSNGMRYGTVLHDLAGEPLSLASMHRFFNSLALTPQMLSDENWEKGSFANGLLAKILERKAGFTRQQWINLDAAIQYVRRQFPNLGERTSSNIIETANAMLGRFAFEPFRTIFSSGECTFFPQDCEAGKIVIVGFPLLEYGYETGRLIGTMMKLAFFGQWLKRDVRTSPNPIIFVADENQYWVTRRDNYFHSTCRGYLIASLCASQSYAAISEALGEDRMGSRSYAYLANFVWKFVLQNSEPETQDHISRLIGNEPSMMGGFDAHGHYHGNEQMQPILQPSSIGDLLTPDEENEYAEALIYKGGQRFASTRKDENDPGLNHIRHYFSRFLPRY